MKKSPMLFVCCIAMVNVYTSASAQWKYEPKPESVKNREWFQSAKFGLFIHWGVYSVSGDGEWVMNNQQIPVKSLIIPSWGQKIKSANFLQTKHLLSSLKTSSASA